MRGDYQGMDCTSCREIGSADLDGEASPIEVAAARRHLDACAPCRSHLAAVTQLHRSARVGPADAVPDLTAAILAAQPGGAAAHPDPEASVWRVGLALVAVAQVLAAAVHVGGDHVARDQASWEVALAAGFAWAAWRPSRANGLLPLTAVLTVLLLANGGFGPAGAGTHHLLAPVGLVLLVLATRRRDRSRPLVAA